MIAVATAATQMTTRMATGPVARPHDNGDDDVGGDTDEVDDYDEEDSFKEGKFATNAYERFRGEAGEQDNLGT